MARIDTNDKIGWRIKIGVNPPDPCYLRAIALQN